MKAAKKTKSSKGKPRKKSAGRSVETYSLLTDDDLHWFNEGTHRKLYQKLGAHERRDEKGVYFAVWAPTAESVTLMSDFNGWNKESHPLAPRGSSGIWEGCFAEAAKGTIYKYHIRSTIGGYTVDKADPYGFHHETPPRTGSIVWDLDYDWNDGAWMAARYEKNRIDAAMSVYEVHLGSWRRGDDNRWLSYREIAPLLAEYVKDMGFSHVELMPIMEHPFYGSWGYQTTGFFAPTSRFGTPQDFMYLVDVLHENEIGVILDWVPSHFPSDEHGLAFFDGTHLYEHADPKKGFHPDWNSFIFNYGRKEVQSFLLSSATYWLDKYHVDGLRVDAVASMLYLDYSRKEGEWIPNEHGGRENLEAIAFLRRFNEAIYESFPDIDTVAEESTSWPMVSRPTYLGGLGFGLKWDMGFMHDTLKYMSLDPVFRKFHQNELTFRMLYAFNENFLLPFSHDEVVYGKGSMLRKMSGDEWQKFANLRALLGYMFGQPGKKLLFMGAEFAQWNEWYHEASLDWNLLDQDERHRHMQQWVRDLNQLYHDEPALHERDCRPEGFEWIDCTDAENSVVSFIRRGESTDDILLAAYNFTPMPRHNYRLGVPREGFWKEILNSDGTVYGGSGQGNLGGLEAAPVGAHGRDHSIPAVLPPLSAVFFKNEASS
jgi:1,4-alpha-glucan branching enzyme